MQDTSLGGYGSQTLSAVTVSGNPDGITTGVRVSYTAGAATPGAIIMPLPLTSTVYSMSAWVLVESGDVASIAFALKGATSGGSPTTFTPGVWTKITWNNYTTPASLVTGNDFAVRLAGNAASTGSFIVTGVIIELGPYVGPWFDGNSAAAGDFSYLWTGATNQSISSQRAMGAGNWAGAGLGVAYQSAVSPWSGAKSVAVMTKGVTGDGAYVGDAAVVAGTTYTFSSWVRVNDVLPSFYGSMRYKDAANATINDYTLNVIASVVVGQYVRLSYTTTAPAGATRLQAMWRIFSAHSPTTFFIDETLIEASPTLLPYFDGSTVAAGDFTYNWTGTANASTSEQRGVQAAGYTVGLNAAAIQSTDWAASGTKSLRVINTGVSKDSFVSLALSPMKAQTYTLLATCRVLAPQTGTPDIRARRIQLYYTGVGPTNSAQAPNVPGVYPLRLTFTITDPAQYLNFRLYNGASLGEGDVWWDNIMLVEGDYQGDYIDGTKPFSKWDGTANNSTSVGYPPQLLDLAGVPEFDYALSAGATYSLTDNFGPQEGRTLYTVYQNTQDIPTGVFQMIAYGSTDLTDTVPNCYITLRQEFYAGPTNIIRTRRTGGGGPQQTTVPLGASVACWGLDSAGNMFIQNNNNAEVTEAFAMSVPNQKIQFNTSSYHTHVRTIMYRGKHDAATRAAVSRYLGNKYGANVA
jgi:hypothetical protein